MVKAVDDWIADSIIARVAISMDELVMMVVVVVWRLYLLLAMTDLLDDVVLGKNVWFEASSSFRTHQ